MSLIVKGLKMPRNCAACPFRLVWCRERIYMETRPNRCPLIEVPPHGRLIDADAVLNAIKKAGEDDSEIADVYKEDYAAVSDWLYTAPTVIEASEVE